MERTVENGDHIKIFYKGYFDDGVVFDSNQGRETLAVEIGEGKLLKKFEEALIGMHVGEEKDIKLTIEQGYGIPREDLLQEIPKEQIPKDAPLKIGVVLTLVSPSGQRLFAKMVEIKEASVVLDLNHPLAGKNLNFHIKMEGFA